MTALDERPAMKAQPDPDSPWWTRAACQGIPWRLFFPDHRPFAHTALAHCRACPVVADCYADAESQGRASGVWGARLWVEGKPINPKPPRPGSRQPAPRRAPQDREATQRSALLLFRQVRHLYSSNTSAARAVAVRYGVNVSTVMAWLRDARATQDA